VKKCQKVLTGFVMVLSFGAVLMLSGCATIEGMGKDIGKAGQSIENAAENASR